MSSAAFVLQLLCVGLQTGRAIYLFQDVAQMEDRLVTVAIILLQVVKVAECRLDFGTLSSKQRM